MSLSMADSSADRRLHAVDEGSSASVSFDSLFPSDPVLSPEIFRQVYVALDLPEDRGPVIGITSSIAGEGRTTIAAALARTLASDLEKTILLIDASFTQPSESEAKHFAPSTSAGLAAVLRGEATLTEVMHQVSDRFFVVTGGNAGSDTARLLRQLSDQDPFQHVRALGAVTVLDLPPLLSHSYSSLAATAADALVLVIRAGVTPSTAVREAIERLGEQPLQGAILNGERSARPRWWPSSRPH
jgi:Mrp family chromosome partitioning ATPase